MALVTDVKTTVPTYTRNPLLDNPEYECVDFVGRLRRPGIYQTFYVYGANDAPLGCDIDGDMAHAFPLTDKARKETMLLQGMTV